MGREIHSTVVGLELFMYLPTVQWWGVEVVKASLDLTGKILILIKED